MRIRYTEIFKSIQGEGLYSGVPSIFIRLWGCNFQCRGFSNPDLDPVEFPIEVLETKSLTDLKSLPKNPFTVGCDSVYSWDKRFLHMSIQEEDFAISQRVWKLLPHHNIFGASWQTGFCDTHLVFTGGEPLMNQKGIIAILDSLDKISASSSNATDIYLKHITFETNGTQKLSPEFDSYLLTWKSRYSDREIHFSLSPKLSFSGHSFEEACVPNAVLSMARNFEYKTSFKFVVRPLPSDFSEIRHFLLSYVENGLKGRYLPKNVFVMPVGSSTEQQAYVDKQVAALCMDYGYRFSPRVHVYLYGNEIGT